MFSGVYFELGRQRPLRKEVSHRDWEPSDGIFEAGKSVDFTVDKIVFYSQLTFIKYKVVPAYPVKENGKKAGWVYRDVDLRNQLKADYGLSDRQDLSLDPDADKVVKVGGKYNNKKVLQIFTKRKSSNLKDGEEKDDKFVFVRLEDKSLIKINKERIASLKRKKEDSK